MGTPDFSLPSLQRLANDDRINIKGVVTQPDRKRGRGQKVRHSPVKKMALSLNLDIFQPESVNKTSFIKKLKNIDPEFIVVVAFGQILSKDILALPEHGCINLHASLLPGYRGAAPIHRAIINGDKNTGITTMYMEEKLDTGDIIYQKEIPITHTETAGTLHDKLAETGAELLCKTLIDVKNGTAPRQKQDDSQATYADKINKKTGKIDWSNSTEDIYNLIRGVTPWPGAYTFINGERLKIWEAEIVRNKGLENKVPGEIIKANEKEGLIISTKNGKLKINKLQLSGRKKMTSGEFLRGYDINSGEVLGN